MGKPQTPGVISKKHYGFQFMINDISINVSMINTKCVLLKPEGLFLSWLKPFRDLEGKVAFPSFASVAAMFSESSCLANWFVFSDNYL